MLCKARLVCLAGYGWRCGSLGSEGGLHVRTSCRVFHALPLLVVPRRAFPRRPGPWPTLLPCFSLRPTPFATVSFSALVANAASAGELIALAEDVLAEEIRAGQRPDGQGVPLPGRAVLLSAIATIDGRVAEPAMHATAAHFGVPLLVFGAARLECETPRLATPSEVVFRLVGCHGVAESAALAAAGPDGALVVAKRKSARATAALARMPADGSPSGFSGFVESKQVPERAFSCDDSASSCFDSGFSGICVAARPGS